MKKSSLLISIGMILPMLYSCSLKTENLNFQVDQDNEHDYTIQLIKKDQRMWRLDSITLPTFHSAFYNQKDSALYYMSNGNIVKCSLNEPFAQSNKINISLSNFCLEEDTIIGIDYGLNKVLAYKDSVLWSKEIPHLVKYPPAPITGISSIMKKDSFIQYFGEIAGDPLDEDSINRPFFGKIDCIGNQDSFSLGYPEIYRKANWGGGILWWVYADYNPNSNLYVISLPISHSLLLFNPDTGATTEYYAGSRDIKSILPYSNDKKDSPSTEASLKYIAETSSYANIFYDKWRDLYYRLAEFSVPYKKGNQRIIKPISVIILDRDFKKLGETKINNPGRNYRYGTFVSHEGLMIPKDTIEDVLLYSIYLPDNYSK